MDKMNFMHFDHASYMIATPYYQKLLRIITSNNNISIRGIARAAGVNYQNVLRFLKGHRMYYQNIDKLRLYIHANFSDYYEDLRKELDSDV
jgi:hypothetical protein